MPLSGRLLIWIYIYEHVRVFAALRIIYDFSIQRIACRRNHNGYLCTRPHRCSPISEMHWTVAKKKAYIGVHKYKQNWNKMAHIYRKYTGSWENFTFYDTSSPLNLTGDWTVSNTVKFGTFNKIWNLILSCNVRGNGFLQTDDGRAVVLPTNFIFTINTIHGGYFQ